MVPVAMLVDKGETSIIQLQSQTARDAFQYYVLFVSLEYQPRR